MRKIDNKAQGSSFLMLMLLFLMILFIMPMIGPFLGYYFGLVLDPLIGFGGKYPILTLFFAGLIVVLFSSLLTNFFTNWRKMGESQEIAKAFQQEISKARKEGNTNRMKKLMQMQPEIFKKQQEAQGGMMKPMVFLIIFIYPIFFWLRGNPGSGFGFLVNLDHYYFTVPWASDVSLYSSPFNFGSAWMWLYLIFSMVTGQILRQGLKYISWSDTWRNIKGKIKPSRV